MYLRHNFYYSRGWLCLHMTSSFPNTYLIRWPWQRLYLRHHNTSNIVQITVTPRVSVFITTTQIRTYIVIFYQMVTATLCTYVIIFIIPVDGYVCIWLLPSQFLSFVSTLDSITSLLDSTLSIFPTHSLVEGGSICRISMCFHPIINLQNFTNNAHCRALANKYLSMCYVLHYAIYMLLLPTRSFTKK